MRAEYPALWDALCTAAAPRGVFLEGSVENTATGVRVCGIEVEGASLRAHLAHCSRALLFAATLGAQVDRLIARYAAISVAQSYILDTMASQMIEEFCDAEQEKLTQRTDGLFLRPRFSPGYGDVDMCVSSSILLALDAEKRIGLCMTRGGMLTPLKSVTAFIGLTPEKQSCHIHKCAACGKKDCVFRKE